MSFDALADKRIPIRGFVCDIQSSLLQNEAKPTML